MSDPGRRDEPRVAGSGSGPGPLSRPAPGTAPDGEAWVAARPEQMASPQRLAAGVWVPGAELKVTVSRSGGPGGQNVNKVNTRATLSVAWPVLEAAMPPWAILRLKEAASRHVTDAGLQITSSEARTLAGNRRHCRERLEAAVAAAMDRPKRRRKTRPSRGSVRRRLDAKKRKAQTKALRKPPPRES